MVLSRLVAMTRESTPVAFEERRHSVYVMHQQLGSSGLALPYGAALLIFSHIDGPNHSNASHGVHGSGDGDALGIRINFETLDPKHTKV